MERKSSLQVSHYRKFRFGDRNVACVWCLAETVYLFSWLLQFFTKKKKVSWNQNNKSQQGFQFSIFCGRWRVTRKRMEEEQLKRNGLVSLFDKASGTFFCPFGGEFPRWRKRELQPSCLSLLSSNELQGRTLQDQPTSAMDGPFQTRAMA